VKIGVIVYSQTGHTFSVAAKLEEKLAAGGHTVNLERVKVAGLATPGATDVQLETTPTIDTYDALVFGSPVWGGCVSSPMTSYLEQIASLQGKEVVCLMTHLFPPGWGGNKAVEQLKGICASKGATVRGSGSVTWLRFARKRQIDGVVDHLVSILVS
jgi:multimeric flavodoxin WrbA